MKGKGKPKPFQEVSIESDASDVSSDNEMDLAGMNDGDDFSDGEDISMDDDESFDLAKYFTPAAADINAAAADNEQSEQNETEMSAISDVVSSFTSAMEDEERGSRQDMTADEIHQLKQTAELYNSSLYRLAIGEVLKEVSVNWTKVGKEIERTLFNVKSRLDSLATVPADGKTSKSQTDRRRVFTTYHDLLAMLCKHLPFEMAREIIALFRADFFSNNTSTSTKKQQQQKWPACLKQALPEPFEVTVPDSVAIIGSFLLRSVAQPNENVDIAVTIPASCFQPRDYGRHMYHVKRAVYLCCIYEALSASTDDEPLFTEIKFAPFRGELRKPVLQMRPNGASKHNRFIIRVIPVISPGAFTALQSIVSDDDSDVLENHRYPAASASPADSSAQSVFYTNSVMEDMFMVDHLNLLHKAMKDCPAMVEAVVLLKLWLYQRGMGTDATTKTITANGDVYGGHGGDSLNGFLIAVLMVYLLDQRKINKHMSSLQMVKLLFNWIIHSDIVTSGASFRPLTQEDSIVNPRGPTQPPISKYQSIMVQNYPMNLTLVDPTGRLNLLARVSRVAWLEVRKEAQLSIEYLANDRSESFAALFLQRQDFFRKFDVLLRIPNVVSPFESQSAGNLLTDSASTVFDSSIRSDLGDQDYTTSIAVRVQSLMLHALADRLEFSRIVPVFASADSMMPTSFIMGVIVKPDTWRNVVVKGPIPTDEAKKAEFDAIWGDKSGMRRFKDGAILMAAHFSVPEHQRHGTLAHVANYLLERHFSPQFSSGDAVDVTMLMKQLYPIINPDEVDEVVLGSMMRKAFEAVKSAIEDVPGTNLPISSITLVAAEARGNTAVYPTRFNPLLAAEDSQFITNPPPESANVALAKANPKRPLNAVIQFSLEARWPNSIAAIRKLFSLIYLTFHRGLKTQGINSSPSRGWLDVVHDGFAFRFVIDLPKELHLLKQEGYGLEPKVRALEYATAHAAIHTPWIASFSAAYPAFSATARLAKRWLAAHMFSMSMSASAMHGTGCDIFEEAVELLVARVFAAPQPHTAPYTAMAGFLRFLHLLATFDWENEPLLVELQSDQLSAEHRANIPKIYEATKEANPETCPVMYIVVSYAAESGSLWTKDAPSRITLRRLVAYAKKSLQMATGALTATDSDPDVWVGLFRDARENYDVLIHIDTTFVENRNKIDYVPTQKQQSRANDVLPISGDSLAAVQQKLSGHMEDINVAPVDAKKRGSGVQTIGFDPVFAFFEELKERFGHLGLFMRDELVDDVIAITWNPSKFLPTPIGNSLKVSEAYLVMPFAQSATQPPNATMVNIFEVLHDICSMGCGIVKSIEINKRSSHRLQTSLSDAPLLQLCKQPKSKPTAAQSVPQNNNKPAKAKKAKATTQPDASAQPNQEQQKQQRKRKRNDEQQQPEPEPEPSQPQTADALPATDKKKSKKKNKKQKVQSEETAVKPAVEPQATTEAVAAESKVESKKSKPKKKKSNDSGNQKQVTAAVESNKVEGNAKDNTKKKARKTKK